ncbi:hypothetical protein BDN71DRAFT_1432915 [Pleurotus eryngii]|uniref:Uncharacterized protein n=1 Tax=Pleurotus eryngii TaxID=5323 RepID=A0A9P5ZST5_PLEER|nr:hypothetical protein BDN71DRAFT_1432915 [Pleurotus eryngii]
MYKCGKLSGAPNLGLQSNHKALGTSEPLAFDKGKGKDKASARPRPKPKHKSSSFKPFNTFALPSNPLIMEGKGLYILLGEMLMKFKIWGIFKVWLINDLKMIFNEVTRYEGMRYQDKKAHQQMEDTVKHHEPTVDKLAQQCNKLCDSMESLIKARKAPQGF